MAKEILKAPSFVEIVFEFRNKEYGAYRLRKKYNRNVMLSLLIGTFVACALIIIPYLNAKANEHKRTEIEEVNVEITMENLDQPAEDYVPPPPPPPPPDVDAAQQARYVPPVVVDSVKPEEAVAFLSFDEIATVVEDRGVDEVVAIVETAQEVVDVVEEIAPFVVVEEMPMYPGGDVELLKTIQNAIVYPERAKENNVQGRVFIQFEVTATGSIGRINVLRGVDAELDAEAVRAVRTVTGFRPGRQGGVAVPVWYQVPITFQLR